MRRTAGTEETSLAAMLTWGVRICEVTSSPSRRMRSRSPGMKSMRTREARSSRAASSRVPIPARSAARAMARYIAPVSMWGMLSARATRRPVVDLPTPEGPSMATMSGLSGTAEPATFRRTRCRKLLSRSRPRRRPPRFRRPRFFHRRQHLHFARRELAPHSGRELRIGDRSDGHPLELRDRVTDGLKHSADLLRAAFPKLHFKPPVSFVVAAAGGPDAFDLAGQRALSFQGDAAPEFVEESFLRYTANLHAVRLY